MQKRIMIPVLALFIISGCAGSKVAKVAKEAYEIQKPVVMETSETNNDRPDWTKQMFTESDGKCYFTGAYMNGADYPLTVRCASAEALKGVVQSINTMIQMEFSSYIHGNNADDVSRYVEDGIAMFTKRLRLTGVRQSDLYYEQVFSAAVMEPRYNCFVKLEMSKADYLKAKVDAMKSVRDRLADAGQVEAKEKAERMLRELKGEV